MSGMPLRFFSFNIRNIVHMFLWWTFISLRISTTSQCTSCRDGLYLVNALDDGADYCGVCSRIDGCLSSITCDSEESSQCELCDSDRYLVNGLSDECVTCSACSEVTYKNGGCTGTVIVDYLNLVLVFVCVFLWLSMHTAFVILFLMLEHIIYLLTFLLDFVVT